MLLYYNYVHVLIYRSFLPSVPQRRSDLEKEKRKLQAEIAELQEQLAAARQRIEDLEAIKARLEKELAQMTQK